jgi:hypothetical protein
MSDDHVRPFASPKLRQGCEDNQPRGEVDGTLLRDSKESRHTTWSTGSYTVGSTSCSSSYPVFISTISYDAFYSFDDVKSLAQCSSYILLNAGKSTALSLSSFESIWKAFPSSLHRWMRTVTTQRRRSTDSSITRMKVTLTRS